MSLNKVSKREQVFPFIEEIKDLGMMGKNVKPCKGYTNNSIFCQGKMDRFFLGIFVGKSHFGAMYIPPCLASRIYADYAIYNLPMLNSDV